MRLRRAGAATVETVVRRAGGRPGRLRDHARGPPRTAGCPTGDEPLRTYAIEANSHIAPPKRYLSRYGQFLEHAPYCERDLRGPAEPLLVEGSDVEVYVKHRGTGPGGLTGTVHVVPEHPFDVVGWDGCLYPYAFNIADFEPITGRVHQPPPVHQVFEGHNFVICNFVPRKVDYHPLAVPVPYYHSNVDSDEIMFYVGGDYEARKGSGIGKGSISLHPGGHTHGPQPGAVERRSAPSTSTSSPSWSTPSARWTSARPASPPTTGSTPGPGRDGGRRHDATLFDGLFDDAALFPPGDAPMADAVPAHRELRERARALVGPFVVPGRPAGRAERAPRRGPGVRDLADRGGRRPAGAPLRRVDGRPAACALAAVEVPVVADAEAAGEAVRRARRRRCPRPCRLRRAARARRRRDEVLDVLAGTRLPREAAHRRPAGRAVPLRRRSSPRPLIACVARDVAFKCTAGLHHAVRHTDPATGLRAPRLPQPAAGGLRAVGRGRHRGSPPSACASATARRHGRGRCATWPPHRAGRARALFTSFGTCSVLEPVDDLVALGLLPSPDRIPA